MGAGQAGRRCAEALRARDTEAEILLIGEEDHPPYDRPPLSKAVLVGEDPGPALFPRTEAEYADRRIALRLGTRVGAIEPEAGRLVTEAGERIGYDQLVLATGARARMLPVPGAVHPQVLTLRNLADAERLRRCLEQRPRVAVIGGGLIGLEVAASARRVGCAVTVLEAADRLMARAVPPPISARIEGLHRRYGVALRLGVTLAAIEARPDGALRLDAGPDVIEADLVVVGIGAVPNAELAEAAGAAVQNGILTDGQGRTSVAGIYAAGEVARFPHPFWNGRLVRLEHWQVAQNQPEAVARAICGQAGAYDELPWFWTDQLGWNIQVLGDPDPSLRLVERDEGERLTALAVDEGGRVRGAVLINNGRDATPCRRLIASGASYDPSRLADPTQPLRSLL